MAADVQVSEVDVLKAYSGKMNGLRNDSIALAVLLDRQIRKMIEDYDRILSDMQRMLQSGEEDCQYTVDRYDRAINMCGEEARSAIGNSDLEAQQKLEMLRMQVESVQNMVRNLQMKLKNAGLKTQNYAAQMDTLANACISYVNRYAEKLQEYKDIKK
jgi:hypothetical protein